jgi:hypothetical protein
MPRRIYLKRFGLAKKQDPPWVADVLRDAKQRGWRFREGSDRRVLVAQRRLAGLWGSRRELASYLQTRGRLRVPAPHEDDERRSNGY